MTWWRFVLLKHFMYLDIGFIGKQEVINCLGERLGTESVTPTLDLMAIIV